MGRRVLVLGARGMLGQTVAAHLSGRGWDVIGTQNTESSASWYVDAEAEVGAWRGVIQRASCEYAINCIGVLKNLIRQDDPASAARAIRVNALFPHLLAHEAAAVGMRVIGISTDGVFAPGRDQALVEVDTCDCADLYGRTKALGEPEAHNALTIRCSIVGRDTIEHKGVLEWLLGQPDQAQVTGFRDQLWNGVTTLQFARLCGALLQTGAFDRARTVSHVHHFCPNPVTDKYQLLCDWRAVTGKAVTIVPATGHSAGSRVLGTVYRPVAEAFPGTFEWPDVLSELFL